jgi:hypothetical protein
MSKEMADVSDDEKRFEPRHDLQIEAWLSPVGASPRQAVSLRNISAGGAMGESSDPPAVGQAVSLQLPNSKSVLALVVWKMDERFGLKFDHEINPAEFIS